MGIFNKKTWTLKKAGNRKTFVNLNTSEKIVVSDVTPTTGDEITSDQMNDLENRINDAIDSLDSSKQDSATAITTSNIGSQHVAYADSAGSASTAWSDITGKPTFATVATSGAYDDLSGRPSLATVATSGSYTDLSDKPTIPTVNNATLTIQKNGTNVATFTANASSNATANISVPTNTNQLTNGAGFITSSGSCASATKATQDGDGATITSRYLRLNTDGGISSFNGNGNYTYCVVATITVRNAYSNYPLSLEVSGRGIMTTHLTVMFQNSNTTDPSLLNFTTDNSQRFYIKKTATSTWQIYCNLTESWGNVILHRVYGFGAGVLTVDTTMSALSSLPSGTTQAVFGGGTSYADSAGSATDSTKIPNTGGSCTGNINFSYNKGITWQNKGHIFGAANQQMHYRASDDTNYGMFQGVTESAWTVCPDKNGNLRLGSPSYKWGKIYSTNGSISTSDRNMKKDIEELTELQSKELILELNPVSYKFKDGTSGRTHYGLIAQDVEDTLNKLGLSSIDFGGLCIDEETVNDFDENGGRINERKTGKQLYSLRYEEFIAPIIKLCQMQQEEINQLKNEIMEIKKMLIK